MVDEFVCVCVYDEEKKCGGEKREGLRRGLKFGEEEQNNNALLYFVVVEAQAKLIGGDY